MPDKFLYHRVQQILLIGSVSPATVNNILDARISFATVNGVIVCILKYSSVLLISFKGSVDAQFSKIPRKKSPSFTISAKAAAPQFIR